MTDSMLVVPSSLKILEALSLRYLSTPFVIRECCDIVGVPGLTYKMQAAFA